MKDCWMHPDCLIREVNYFISDILIFSWKFQTVSLSGKENFLKHHYSPGGGGGILQSCEINLFLHSHIWFYFYSFTSNLKEKALKVNPRFFKMSDSAWPSSLQNLPEDSANFYFGSASVFIICFTTWLHVLKNWRRWISPIVYKNSRETNGLKN